MGAVTGEPGPRFHGNCPMIPDAQGPARNFPTNRPEASAATSSVPFADMCAAAALLLLRFARQFARRLFRFRSNGTIPPVREVETMFEQILPWAALGLAAL